MNLLISSVRSNMKEDSNYSNGDDRDSNRNDVVATTSATGIKARAAERQKQQLVAEEATSKTIAATIIKMVVVVTGAAVNRGS